ncbi:hypothetical protein BGZ93_001931 [Podila epicladia]|nr:hypothetical protein BGZ93_001931 [Podila epicladia]KAG0084430.1 hypothetical protein BGZ92_009891 [Podila epicladia]
MSTSTAVTKIKPHPHGARLLCLDGGGVRGIVSLIILDKIMKLVQDNEKLEVTPRPSKYFELAAGTSAGGITAIMLFRLHMTAQEAIEQYKSLSQEAFRLTFFGWGVPTFLEGFVSNIKVVFKTTRFDSKALDKAIENVVEKYGLDEDDKAKKGKAKLCHPLASKIPDNSDINAQTWFDKVLGIHEANTSVVRFACTVVKNRSEAALLRSYYKNTEQDETRHDSSSLVDTVLHQGRDEITIGLTVKATSAAPTYFPEVFWKPASVNPGQWVKTKGTEKGLVFWDGGLLNNNPINQLWSARYDLVTPEEPEPPISCVISIGTGYKNPGDERPSLWLRLINIATSVVAFVTNTDAKNKDFRHHMNDLNRREQYKNTKYIRLNPDLDKFNIGLADYTKISDLESLTLTYLEKEEAKEKLKLAVDAICPPRPLRDSVMSS